LAVGVPVVASDTAYRPDGVIRFRIGDIQDLVEKVKYVMGHLEEIRAQNAVATRPISKEHVINLYRELIHEA
jgi:hypothetical protein